MRSTSLVRSFLGGLLLVSAVSCISVGQPFREDAAELIEIGTTTKADVRSQLGSPWRTGVEDGQETWTYGTYRYAAVGRSRTRDLVVRFDDRGVVVSYTYSTTEPR